LKIQRLIQTRAKRIAVKILAESVLIIFSVLFAFWLDRKGKESEENDLKNALLNRVYDDLKSDSLNYSIYLNRLDFVSKKLETLLYYTSSKNIESDSLTHLISFIEWQFQFVPNNSTYLSIISSGQLNFFERDPLFIDISSYYNFDQKKMVDHSQSYSKNLDLLLEPYLNSYFDRRLLYEDTKQAAQPIDVNSFRNKAFTNILLSLRDHFKHSKELVKHKQELEGVLKKIRNRKESN
jgi:hypothetical protein